MPDERQSDNIKVNTDNNRKSYSDFGIDERKVKSEKQINKELEKIPEQQAQGQAGPAPEGTGISSPLSGATQKSPIEEHMSNQPADQTETESAEKVEDQQQEQNDQDQENQQEDDERDDQDQEDRDEDQKEDEDKDRDKDEDKEEEKDKDEKEDEESKEKDEPEEEPEGENDKSDENLEDTNEPESPEETASEEPSPDEVSPQTQEPAPEQPQTDLPELPQSEGAPQSGAAEGGTGSELTKDAIMASGADDAAELAATELGGAGSGAGATGGAAATAGASGAASTAGAGTAGGAAAGGAAAGTGAAAAGAGAAEGAAVAAGGSAAAGGGAIATLLAPEIVIPVVIIIIALFIIIFIIIAIVAIIPRIGSDNTNPENKAAISNIKSAVSTNTLTLTNLTNDLKAIEDGNIGEPSLHTISYLAANHDNIQINFTGEREATPGNVIKNDSFEFDVISLDKIKCTDKNTGAKITEVPIYISPDYDWKSQVLPGYSDNIICAVSYYPMIEARVNSDYSTEYGPGEFSITELAQKGPQAAQEKSAELIAEVIAQDRLYGIDASSPQSRLPVSITINKDFFSKNIKNNSADGINTALKPKIDQAYSELDNDPVLRSQNKYRGIHISFL